MKKLLLGLLVGLFVLAACAPPAPPEEEEPPVEEPAEQEAPAEQEELVRGDPEPAGINTVDILLAESFPVQASLHVTGFVDNSCTELGEIKIDRQGNTFVVYVEQIPVEGEGCEDGLSTFEHSIPLDILDLPAGTYDVDVNGVASSFQLLQANSAEEAPLDLEAIPDNVEVGLAPVSTVDVVEIDAEGETVTVLVEGNLPDGCTQIAGTEVEQDEMTFNLYIVTLKPLDMMCTMALVPYAETIVLDMAGQPAGEYTVTVDEAVSTVFFWPGSSGDLLVSPQPDPQDGMTGDMPDMVESGPAMVETVDVQSVDEAAGEVALVVTVTLPDSCTDLGEVEIEQTDLTTFEVTIGTVRPADMMCATMIQSVSTQVVLDVAGLPAGEYTVIVNGVEATFELEGTSSSDASAPSLGDEPKVEREVAPVTDISLAHDADTGLLTVIAGGQLPDGCTQIAPVVLVTMPDSSTIELLVRTIRPVDMMCTQVITEFAKEIVLDVSGLAPGAYTVDVNGVTDTITLP